MDFRKPGRNKSLIVDLKQTSGCSGNSVGHVILKLSFQACDFVVTVR